MLRFISLGSGSRGNATLIEATSGACISRLLVDCGLGLRQMEARLAAAGVPASSLDAVFVTHEHADHIGSALSLAMRHRIPVWASRGTREAVTPAAGIPMDAGLWHESRDGEVIDLGALQVRPFTVPHDAREPLQLTCTDGDRRLGVVTDLGHASAHVIDCLRGCDALLIEANHCPDLLSVSPYPPFLRRRIAGAHGHLSNAQSADLLRAVTHAGLRLVVAAHLSEVNNRPERAQTALAEVMGCRASELPFARPNGSPWFSV